MNLCERINQDRPGLGRADDVGIATGGEVALHDFSRGIDQDQLRLSPASVDADFEGGVRVRS